MLASHIENIRGFVPPRVEQPSVIEGSQPKFRRVLRKEDLPDVEKILLDWYSTNNATSEEHRKQIINERTEYFALIERSFQPDSGVHFYAAEIDLNDEKRFMGFMGWVEQSDEAIDGDALQQASPHAKPTPNDEQRVWIQLRALYTNRNLLKDLTENYPREVSHQLKNEYVGTFFREVVNDAKVIATDKTPGCVPTVFFYSSDLRARGQEVYRNLGYETVDQTERYGRRFDIFLHKEDTVGY